MRDNLNVEVESIEQIARKSNRVRRVEAIFYPYRERLEYNQTDMREPPSEVPTV